MPQAHIGKEKHFWVMQAASKSLDGWVKKKKNQMWVVMFARRGLFSNPVV